MRGLYAIRNKVTGKYYVGETLYLRKREIQHFSNLKTNKHENDYLQKSYNKYGKDAFEFIILEADNSFTLEELNEKEKYYIEYFDSYKNGYNLTVGGEGTQGRLLTEEEKKRKSQEMKGEKNHFYGKQHSQETKKLLSKRASEKVGQKNPFYGKTHSPDWKEKRRMMYERKIEEGWVDPKKGKSQPKEAVQKMKENMPHRKSIMVDGKEYMSISECSRLTGIKLSTIHARLKNDNFPNYQYVEKINA